MGHGAQISRRLPPSRGSNPFISERELIYRGHTGGCHHYLPSLELARSPSYNPTPNDKSSQLGVAVNPPCVVGRNPDAHSGEPGRRLLRGAYPTLQLPSRLHRTREAGGSIPLGSRSVGAGNEAPRTKRPPHTPRTASATMRAAAARAPRGSDAWER